MVCYTLPFSRSAARISSTVAPLHQACALTNHSQESELYSPTYNIGRYASLHTSSSTTSVVVKDPIQTTTTNCLPWNAEDSEGAVQYALSCSPSGEIINDEKLK